MNEGKDGAMEVMKANVEGIGKKEPRTGLTCEWCRKDFATKSRNGVMVRFCQDKCSDNWWNDQRSKGAAIMKKKTEQKIAQAKKRATRKPQRMISFDGIPPNEQAQMLANMALEVGVTEGPVVSAARYAEKAIAICRAKGLPFKSRRVCKRLIKAAKDPVKKMRLEAILQVMETERCFG